MTRAIVLKQVDGAVDATASPPLQEVCTAWLCVLWWSNSIGGDVNLRAAAHEQPLVFGGYVRHQQLTLSLHFRRRVAAAHALKVPQRPRLFRNPIAQRDTLCRDGKHQQLVGALVGRVGARCVDEVVKCLGLVSSQIRKPGLSEVLRQGVAHALVEERLKRLSDFLWLRTSIGRIYAAPVHPISDAANLDETRCVETTDVAVHLYESALCHRGPKAWLVEPCLIGREQQQLVVDRLTGDNLFIRRQKKPVAGENRTGPTEVRKVHVVSTDVDNTVTMTASVSWSWKDVALHVPVGV